MRCYRGQRKRIRRRWELLGQWVSFNHAIRWIGGSPTALGNLCSTCLITATAVNSDGTVMVGEAQFVQNGPITAYRWVNGTITNLGQLQGGNSNALAVSADGSVVVGQGGGGNGQAFIWTAATGMQTLSAVLAAANVDLTGWGLTQATGISADGTVIVGNGTYGNQGTGWIAHLAGSFSLTATHDFNGDGKSDIAWRNSDGDVGMWLMNGTQILQQPGFGQRTQQLDDRRPARLQRRRLC